MGHVFQILSQFLNMTFKNMKKKNSALLSNLLFFAIGLNHSPIVILTSNSFNQDFSNWFFSN